MQCRGNLSKAGAAFAATGYHQKINQFKIKIAKKACYSDCAMLCGVSWATLQTSIKITLCMIFSQAMLSEGSWATLRKAFTCVILSQEYLDNIEQDFSCAVLSEVFWTTLHKGFTCAMMSQEN